MASKKKTSWKTLAGLVLAAATWRSIAEDLPIHGDIIPPAEPPKRPDPPTCPPLSTAKWDDENKVWRCVPKGLL